MLKNIYTEQIAPKLQKELDLKSIMAVPRITKVVIDMGVGVGSKDKEIIQNLAKDLAIITGQRPQIRQALRAISGFGTRKGDPIGVRVTLRRARMYGFLEKLIKVVLPRLRDFRGVPKTSFDGRGNYTLGTRDHTIFPEIETSSAKPWGLGITIVTTAKNNEEARRLLEELGMPFEKGEAR